MPSLKRSQNPEKFGTEECFRMFEDLDNLKPNSASKQNFSVTDKFVKPGPSTSFMNSSSYLQKTIPFQIALKFWIIMTGCLKFLLISVLQILIQKAFCQLH